MDRTEPPSPPVPDRAGIGAGVKHDINEKAGSPDARGLSAHIAYLQGLAEGLGVEDGGPRAQLLKGTLDALDILAHEAEGVEDTVITLSTRLKKLDRRLSQLERALDDEEAVWEVPCPGCMEVFVVSGEVLFSPGQPVLCPHCDTAVRWGPQDERTEKDGPSEAPAPDTPEHLDGGGLPHVLMGDHRDTIRPRPQSRIGHPPVPDPPKPPVQKS